MQYADPRLFNLACAYHVQNECPTYLFVCLFVCVVSAAFYKQKLVNALGNGFANNFIIEKKADATYKVVSAASIVAKVTRDSIVSNWVWAEPTVNLSKNYGSGYPGDEKCVQWLAKASHPVFGYPNMVRFSWSTAREALEKSGAVSFMH